MKNKLLLLLISTLLVPVSIFAFAEDWRLWNTETVSGNITEKLSAALQAEFRWKNDMGDYYYNHEDLSLSYKCLNWLSITGSFREIFSLIGTSWKYENQPNVAATVNWNWADFKLSNQFRYAYRAPEDANDFSEYRNNFMIVSPWKVTPLEINPYVGDFVYYHSNTSKWDENRLYAGINFKIYGPVKGALYYLLQSVETNDNWTNYNTLGTAINVKF